MKNTNKILLSLVLVIALGLTCVLTLAPAGGMGTVRYMDRGVDWDPEETAEFCDTNDLNFVPGQILVVFEHMPLTRSAYSLSDALSDYSGEISAVMSFGQDTGTIVTVELPDGLTLEQAIAEYEENPMVKFAQPIFIYHTMTLRRPNDPALADPNDKESYQWHLDAVNTFEAWERLSHLGGRPEITVAVIDEQIQMDHPDLTGNLLAGKARNIQSKNINDPSAWTNLDPAGEHGTHVAGIIAATANNGIGVAGVASGMNNDIVRIMPINAFEWNDAANRYAGALSHCIAAAIRFAADNGASVINMSFGYNGATDLILKDAIDYAHNKGVVMVAAAGNDNDSRETYPSDYSNVIGVIGVTNYDYTARRFIEWRVGVNPRFVSGGSGSSYGSAKNISAPGARIWSTLPGDIYGVKFGTSMASPIVAAVAAMILYADPGLTNTEVEQILYKTATDVHTAGKDNQTGWGVVDAGRAVQRVLDSESKLAHSYTVTFHGNGGSPTSQTKMVNSPETTVREFPAPPTRTNHRFNGWNTMPNGTGSALTASTQVKGNMTVYAQWAFAGGSGGSGGGGSGGGGSGGGGGSANLIPFASMTPANMWLEQSSVGILVAGAKGRGEDFVRTNSAAGYGVRGSAWPHLAVLRYEHDTIADNAVQVRLYINNPGNLSRDTLLSGYVRGPQADRLKASFTGWYSNKIQVLHFDQRENWERPVYIAARIDLQGMDTGNLILYSYDREANTIREIANPGYWIDTGGYLRFQTPYAGDIIVSERRLELRA